MVIEGNGYKMEKLTDASFYNLSIPVKVHAGTDKEREEFKIVGYGMPFDSCIKQIVDYRMAKLEGVYSLKEYIDLYENMVNELGKDFD
jgi:hypothetical protein